MTGGGAPTSVEWTWADYVSSARFWALAALSAATVISNSTALTWLPSHYAAHEVSVAQTGEALAFRALFAVLGFPIAFWALRLNPRLCLVAAGAAQLAGLLPLIVYVHPLSFLGLASLCAGGAGSAVSLVAVPAVIASGRPGLQAFLVAFGALFTMQPLTPSLVGLAGFLIDPETRSLRLLGLMLATALLAVTACLACIDARLFTTAPRPRDRRFALVRRTPTAVFALSFVPFYFPYWLYRAHGEGMTVAPSARLLSPVGAFWFSFLFFAPPVMLTTLADELNAAARTLGRKRLVSAGGVFWLALILPPLAAAFVQSALNDFAAPRAGVRMEPMGA